MMGDLRQDLAVAVLMGGSAIGTLFGFGYLVKEEIVHRERMERDPTYKERIIKEKRQEYEKSRRASQYILDCKWFVR